MTEVTRMRWLVFQSMPEHLVRRHSQRKIREDDFSLTSGDVCAPAQTSGVKNLVSTRFFTLSKHAGENPVPFYTFLLNFQTGKHIVSGRTRHEAGSVPSE